jgi:hypothetical protein
MLSCLGWRDTSDNGSIMTFAMFSSENIQGLLVSALTTTKFLS